MQKPGVQVLEEIVPVMSGEVEVELMQPRQESQSHLPLVMT